MPQEIQPAFTDDDLATLVANYPDLAKGFGVGVARGAINVGGLVGDTRELATRFAGSMGIPEAHARGAINRMPFFGPAISYTPTSPELQQAVEGQTGPFYEPVTPYGRFARNGGEMAVQAAVGGPLMRGLKTAIERQWSWPR
jgi:hypothetical protein